MIKPWDSEAAGSGIKGSPLILGRHIQRKKCGGWWNVDGWVREREREIWIERERDRYRWGDEGLKDG